MTLCDQCLKPITGQYVYNPDKKDEDKKFCSTACMHEYYSIPCDKCGKKIFQWLHSPDKNDGKKFCSSSCMNKYYEKETEKSVSDFWGKYKGWIIGGGIVLVLLIILGVIFGGKKKRR